MEYQLELDRVISEVKKSKAKRVLIQLPDGLKPKAKEIIDSLKETTAAEYLIWAGSCFGACDIPYDVEKLKIDLILTWGHSRWERNEIK